jgi:restriction system protein
MARRSHTTTRARRTREAEEGIVALALLLFAALWRMSADLNWRTLLVLGVFGTTIAIVVIRWVVQRQRRQARERLLLADAASLTPLDFERRVQLLLADLGWERLAHVGGAGDGGVDVRGSFGGQRYIVQCVNSRAHVSTHRRQYWFFRSFRESSVSVFLVYYRLS